MVCVTTYNITIPFPTDPNLTVSVHPPSLTTLDTEPYNKFTLLCTATVAENVTLKKTFEWKMGPLGYAATVVPDSNTSITSTALTEQISTSVLTTVGTLPGTIYYSCTATALSYSSSDTSTVTIKGL